MKILFRATDEFMSRARSDLMRPHSFAHERVGFIATRAARGVDHLVLFAEDYHPVADNDYLRDPTVGAMMSQEALRKALEVALFKPVGMFHVHMHKLGQRLWFSNIDLREQRKFVPDFFKVRPQMPHGAIVLSTKSAAGRAWLTPDETVSIDEFNVVGSKVAVTRARQDGSTDFYV